MLVWDMRQSSTEKKLNRQNIEKELLATEFLATKVRSLYLSCPVLVLVKTYYLTFINLEVDFLAMKNFPRT